MTSTDGRSWILPDGCLTVCQPHGEFYYYATVNGGLLVEDKDQNYLDKTLVWSPESGSFFERFGSIRLVRVFVSQQKLYGVIETELPEPLSCVVQLCHREPNINVEVLPVSYYYWNEKPITSNHTGHFWRRENTLEVADFEKSDHERRFFDLAIDPDDDVEMVLYRDAVYTFNLTKKMIVRVDKDGNRRQKPTALQTVTFASSRSSSIYTGNNLREGCEAFWLILFWCEREANPKPILLGIDMNTFEATQIPIQLRKKARLSMAVDNTNVWIACSRTVDRFDFSDLMNKIDRAKEERSTQLAVRRGKRTCVAARFQEQVAHKSIDSSVTESHKISLSVCASPRPTNSSSSRVCNKPVSEGFSSASKRSPTLQPDTSELDFLVDDPQPGPSGLQWTVPQTSQKPSFEKRQPSLPSGASSSRDKNSNGSWSVRSSAQRLASNHNLGIRKQKQLCKAFTMVAAQSKSSSTTQRNYHICVTVGCTNIHNVAYAPFYWCDFCRTSGYCRRCYIRNHGFLCRNAPPQQLVSFDLLLNIIDNQRLWVQSEVMHFKIAHPFINHRFASGLLSIYREVYDGVPSHVR
ncbi:hypothetical protein L596_022181 [Steinernema carpocapsae]|uniref:Uncharacterized protein n=1 Tax=Steinernema carpocapsae TaxID=34508 RepID=A0A4U5ML03_STECR|nr:hypothetical protein L596_022181 [Steinernema carpocapsae]